jgi:hypothetical protein
MYTLHLPSSFTLYHFGDVTVVIGVSGGGIPTNDSDGFSVGGGVTICRRGIILNFPILNTTIQSKIA